MEKNDKVHFILEQMRLCLANKDHIRTQIISRKINIKFFQDESDLVQVNFIECLVLCLLCTGSVVRTVSIP